MLDMLFIYCTCQGEQERIIQQLRDRVSELESKLNPSTSFVDDVLDQSTGLNLGPGTIYLIGGYDGRLWLSTMDSFSPSMDTLTSLRKMNYARAYASAAALNGSIYFFGGGDGSSWSDAGTMLFFTTLNSLQDAPLEL